MTTTHPTELTAEQYAEKLTNACRLRDRDMPAIAEWARTDDPEWPVADRIAFVIDQTVLHIHHCTGVEIRNIDRDAVRAMVEHTFAK